MAFFKVVRECIGPLEGHARFGGEVDSILEELDLNP